MTLQTCWIIKFHGFQDCFSEHEQQTPHGGIVRLKHLWKYIEPHWTTTLPVALARLTFGAKRNTTYMCHLCMVHQSTMKARLIHTNHWHQVYLTGNNTTQLTPVAFVCFCLSFCRKFVTWKNVIWCNVLFARIRCGSWAQGEQNKTNEQTNQQTNQPTNKQTNKHVLNHTALSECTTLGTETDWLTTWSLHSVAQSNYLTNFVGHQGPNCHSQDSSRHEVSGAIYLHVKAKAMYHFAWSLVTGLVVIWPDRQAKPAKPVYWPESWWITRSQSTF